MCYTAKTQSENRKLAIIIADSTVVFHLGIYRTLGLMLLIRRAEVWKALVCLYMHIHALYIIVMYFSLNNTPVLLSL